MDALLFLKKFFLGHLPFIDAVPMIIPTVLIPLTAVSVLLTSLAGLVASWFGIKLNTEGPKQLLEVMLKKRVLISAVVLNIVFYAGYKGYGYVKTLPSFIYTIEKNSNKNAIASNTIYSDSLGRIHQYKIPEFKAANTVSLITDWTIKLPKGAFRSAAASDQSLFLGVDDGNVYEINKNNGKTLRQFFIGTQVTTRPVIFKNKMYVGEGNHYTHHARIYSFDLSTGKFINSFKTLGHTEGQPWIHTFNNQSLILATAGKDGLYALDPLNLSEKWHVNHGHLDATVTAEENIVFSGSGVEKGFEKSANGNKSYASAIEFNSGKTIWKKELPMSNWMHPLLTKEDVCYVLGEIYFESQTGLFHCLNKKTGAPHFTIPFEAPLASKPLLITDGITDVAIISDFVGNICGVNLNLKEKIWCHKTGKEKTDYALSSADYDEKNGIVWYASLDNGLFGFDVITGKEIIHWTPSKEEKKWKSTYASVTISGDALYLADITGVVRKLKMKN